MAAWMTLEEESGTSRHTTHPHNGYYAGDFSSSQDRQQNQVGRDSDTPKMSLLVLATGDRLRLW
jgi:hypothetical protein